MHILLIGLHRFAQPTGLCRYTTSLFLALRKMPGVRVTLVLGSWQEEYYAKAFKLDVSDPEIIWVSLRAPAVSRYWWYMFGAPKLARKLGASVVHAVFPMPLLKSQFDCPIVTTVHDFYAWDSPETIGYPNVWLNKLVVRQSVRTSDGVISISKVARQGLLRLFPRLLERMALPVVYQVFSPKTLKHAVTSPSSTGAGSEFLLCVAQHRKHKNLDLAIEAFFKAVDRGILSPEANLVIVGSSGPQTRELHELAARRPGVRFLTAIPDEQLAELYRDCRAMICTSSIEGFCLPVAEALTFSCRVVCSDIPILREVAGEQGIYFPLDPRSADAIVDALQRSFRSTRHLNRTSPILEENFSQHGANIYRQVLNRGSAEDAFTFASAPEQAPIEAEHSRELQNTLT
jgi:glycosyltransferase involved in cell wall biosynthesis